MLITTFKMQNSILIVEDDLDQARIFRTFLENNGFEVTCFLDSYEALENFKLDINYYSIILTDFRLNGISGTLFAKEIRRLRGKSIFIILMTAYFIDPTLREREVVNVIDKVIVKPFTLEFLNKTITSYLNHHN
ncbi:MAG: response regulator [Candidatus Nitrosocosmicus sp.]